MRSKKGLAWLSLTIWCQADSLSCATRLVGSPGTLLNITEISNLSSFKEVAVVASWPFRPPPATPLTPDTPHVREPLPLCPVSSLRFLAGELQPPSSLWALQMEGRYQSTPT